MAKSIQDILNFYTIPYARKVQIYHGYLFTILLKRSKKNMQIFILNMSDKKRCLAKNSWCMKSGESCTVWYGGNSIKHICGKRFVFPKHTTIMKMERPLSRYCMKRSRSSCRTSNYTITSTQQNQRQEVK